MITLPPRESRDRFDLDDNVCWALIPHRKSQSRQGRSLWKTLLEADWTCSWVSSDFYTMTAIDTDLEIVAAGFDTQGYLERAT